MARVTLKQVKKSYASTQVIHGIDMDVNEGEFIVVVGPSGCGKSTLLRMLAGLETVTDGEILIDDNCINELEPMERNIAMVFQNYALYPHMTIFDNMAYSLKIARVDKAEIEQRVHQAADLLQIREFLGRKPKQLSGGQRQRVAMGRAIVRKPALFLFDEPLSNLDAKLRVQMRLEIRKLQRDLGVTSVYVTHDQVEAMTMGDRLLVLNGGVLEQYGTPIDVYQRPASTFVAQFIGSPAMNLLPGQTDGQNVTLPNGHKLPVATDYKGEISIGMRPEHLVLDASGAIEVEAEAVEQLGSATLLHGKLKSTKLDMVVSIPGFRSQADLGASCCFSIDPEHLHLFAKSTGKRIDK